MPTNVQQSEIFKDFRRKALFKPFESVLCLLFYVSFKMPSHPKYHLVFLVDEYPALEDAVKLPRSTFWPDSHSETITKFRRKDSHKRSQDQLVVEYYMFI